MLAKIKLGEYGRDIRPGKYALSPSMTYDEILKIITTGVAVNGEEDTGSSDSGDREGTSATEEKRTTEEASTEARETQEGEDADEGSDGEGGAADE